MEVMREYALLTKILDRSEVKEEISEFDKLIKKTAKKPKPWTHEQSEMQAVYNFMFGNEKDVLAVNEIFWLLQNKIRSLVDIITYDPEKFLSERYKINGEEITKQVLETLYADFVVLIKKPKTKKTEN